MIAEIWNLLASRGDFFLGLLVEHIQISLAAIVIAILLGGLIGILISECRPGAKPTLAVVSFLYTIPSISMLGFLIPFSGVGNLTAVIALTIYALLPMVRNTHTGITNIDPLLLEAAKGMGSTRLQTLVRIIVPCIKDTIATNTMLNTLSTLGVFGLIWALTGGGPGMATNTLPIYMYNMGLKNFQLGQGTAIGMLLLLVGAVCSIIYTRVLKTDD